MKALPQHLDSMPLPPARAQWPDMPGDSNPRRPNLGVAPPKPGRLAGLDFAKGALVLIMVLYHWLNYFVGLDSPLYTYLRFLTPSFIFVTGFLVAHVYLPRFAAGEPGVSSRLIRRGLKLMGIVLVLNAAARMLGSSMIATRTGGQSTESLAWAYLTGATPVAFSVLVPIGYLLIVSAGLLILSCRLQWLCHLMTMVLVATVVLLEWNDMQNGYVEMVSFGMLGLSVGHVAIGRINKALRHWAAILIAYTGYLCAITALNAVYLIQIVGVSVNLAVFYRVGNGSGEAAVLKRLILRLGEYSLFAYISQIVTLQLLRRALPIFLAGPQSGYVALCAGAVCTVLAVEALDRARRRVTAVNRLYSIVFA